MSLFESLAKALGEKKGSFKAISTVTMVSNLVVLLYFVVIINYYSWPVVLSGSNVKNTPYTPERGSFIAMVSMWIIFSLAQLVSLITSIIWVAQNFGKENKTLRKISMFGTVFQVLNGLGMIITGVCFIALIPILPMVSIITISIVAVMEVWWVVAALCSFAQYKWMSMVGEDLLISSRPERINEDQEQLIH